MGMWHKLQPSATFVTGSPMPKGQTCLFSNSGTQSQKQFACVNRMDSNANTENQISYLGSGKRSDEVHSCACQTFTFLPHFSICSSDLTLSELREGLCSPGCVRAQTEEWIVNRNSCLRTESGREGKGHELEISEGH